MNVFFFQYLINCLCKLMMTAVKEAMGTVREMGSRRNSITKGVRITCCIRQSANILPDIESQLHFPCFVPLAVQKWGREKKKKKGTTANRILKCRLGKKKRKPHLTGVQVSALSHPAAHSY